MEKKSDVNVNFGVDPELLGELERTLDIKDPEQGKVPIKLLGFGEISLVFEIIGDKNPNLAYKRLPIFSNEEQVNRHIDAYNKYNRLLTDEVGINVPPSDTAWFYMKDKKNKKRNKKQKMEREKQKISLYCIQEKVPPETIGNRVIHQLSGDEIKTLVLKIMRELKKVWEFNKIHEDIQIGFDGQISNWSIVNYNENDPHVLEETKLLYLDTSTPMYREGKFNPNDAMEGKLFLKSAPSFIRWLLKWLFLQEVLDRYYDWRLVTIDLLANFYKEQLPDVIPSLIETVNTFFSSEAIEFEIKPLTLKELESYYKGDKRIWVIFQNMRRFDRWIKTKILRKRYDFYLPEKIKR
ncbi:MAG: DUF6206 family protein [Promethearchaeota archaeon]